jgi:hypothetical protein
MTIPYLEEKLGSEGYGKLVNYIALKRLPVKIDWIATRNNREDRRSIDLVTKGTLSLPTSDTSGTVDLERLGFFRGP